MPDANIMDSMPNMPNWPRRNGPAMPNSPRRAMPVHWVASRAAHAGAFDTPPLATQPRHAEDKPKTRVYEPRRNGPKLPVGSSELPSLILPVSAALRTFPFFVRSSSKDTPPSCREMDAAPMPIGRRRTGRKNSMIWPAPTPKGTGRLASDFAYFAPPSGAGDFVPCMVEVAKLAWEQRNNETYMFDVGDSDGEDDADWDAKLRICNAERGHLLLERIVYGLMSTPKWWQYQILGTHWQEFTRRQALIKSVEAIEHMVERAAHAGHRPDRLLWDERMCFFRYRLGSSRGNIEDAVFNAACAKLLQLLFFICLTHDALMLERAMHGKVPEEVRHNLLVRGLLRQQLKQKQGEDEEDAEDEEDPEDDHLHVNPIHWEWMSLEIALEDLPAYKNLVGRLKEMAQKHPQAHALTMSFYRQLLGGMCSQLRIRLDRAQGFYTKAVGLLAGGFTSIFFMVWSMYGQPTAEIYKDIMTERMHNMTHDVYKAIMTDCINNVTHGILNLSLFYGVSVGFSAASSATLHFVGLPSPAGPCGGCPGACPVCLEDKRWCWMWPLEQH